MHILESCLVAGTKYSIPTSSRKKRFTVPNGFLEDSVCSWLVPKQKGYQGRLFMGQQPGKRQGWGGALEKGDTPLGHAPGEPPPAKYHLPTASQVQRPCDPITSHALENWGGHLRSKHNNTASPRLFQHSHPWNSSPPCRSMCPLCWSHLWQGHVESP